jgi:arginyl-tRNA synthetase
MQSLASLLSSRVEAAAGVDPEMRPATKPQFGHFQSNVALRLAKHEGRPPREVAQRLVERIDVADLCEPLRSRAPASSTSACGRRAGPRRLRPARPTRTAASTRPRRHRSASSSTTRSPNVAKQMHVGHLRTTIIGDCFNRVLTASGHTVIPRTTSATGARQFGMLIEQVLDEGSTLAPDLDGADALYQRANAR